MYFSKIAAVALGVAFSVSAVSIDTRQTTDSSSTSSKSQCKCGPTDSCWPNAAQWAGLNKTVNGRLIKTVPIGSVCHTTTIVEQSTIHEYNAAQCASVQTNWNIPQFHELSSSSMMTPFFTNNSCNPFDPKATTCTMGDYVHYAVNVSTVAHVQATIAFAQKYNIRFVIRNTGHDFMGKSTGYGALSIWTHYVTGMEIVNYSDSYYTGPAVKAMAGTQVGDLYDFTHDAGYAVIGGECSTVGWSGGYSSGGGHSALTSWKGLAADQTLEFEVILANGQLVTANRHQNSDLWWALSGGGPGNYGIVWSLTSKVYPDIIVTGANIFVPQGTASDAAFWEFIDYYHTFVANYTAMGAYAYAFYQTGYFQLDPFFGPELTTAQVNAAIAPLLAKLKALNITYTSTITTYPNFRDAFYGQFAPINTGLFSFGGRLIPESVISKNASAFSSAVKSITAGGASIIEVGLAPTLQVAGHPGNSVLPAWRDSIIYLIPAAPWNQTAGGMPQNLAYRKTITTVWDPALKALTPGGGSYMSEADSDNPTWKHDWYGANYARLLCIKQQYDPGMFFYAPKAVGSDFWTVANSGKMCRTSGWSLASDEAGASVQG